MDIAAELKNEDFDKLFDQLTSYAASVMNQHNIKDFDGLEPEDFVANVIEKTINGKRNWDKTRFSFREFLFGAVRSELSNYKKKMGWIEDFDVELIPSPEDLIDFERQKSQVIELLIDNEADEIEVGIFECWVVDNYKSAIIAKELGVPVEDIYNGTKRLERRLKKIEPIIKLSYEK